MALLILPTAGYHSATAVAAARHATAVSRVEIPLQRPMIRLWVSHGLLEMRLWVDLRHHRKTLGRRWR